MSRHMMRGRQLSRDTEHRKALRRNMAQSLFEHGSIRTTEAKAKEMRPFIEKLITLAKEPTVHRRRLAKAKLGNKHDVEIKKLFDVLGPRFLKRPGGYTRILKLSKRRLGDGGEQAIIEFVERSPKGEPGAPPPLAAEAPEAAGTRRKGKKAAAGA